MLHKSRSSIRAAPKSGKLIGKVALINNGGEGIGRAVAELFAQEGAAISISCKPREALPDKPPNATYVPEKTWLTLQGNSSDTAFCIHSVERTLQEYGGLDILVNNSDVPASVSNEPLDCPKHELDEHFDHNLLSMLYMTRCALFYMSEGSVILNTVPVQTCPCTAHHRDHLATRLAVISFTGALAQELAHKRIRVNAVSPGSESPPKPEPQPERIAPSYLFLASSDSSSMTGQVLYPLGN